MKLVTIIFALLSSAAAFSQVTVKAGFALGNRWNETLQSQTMGKGFRLAVEKIILPRLTVGAEVSTISFNPNAVVNVRYNAYSLLTAYYLNTKKLQPFIGLAFGYTHYQDNTTLNLGGGISSKQLRKKNYGNVSPFLGVKYHVDKKMKAAFFLQGNADFVPVATIDPIGFVSVVTGVVYRL